MRVRAVTWNLFHGRDAPPEPGLLTWRSRLARVTERGESHAQVNRELLDEFTAVLERGAPGRAWDVALLQECPPRWAAPLERACGARGHRALTSRNSWPRLRALAARLSPDLVASSEGGSNVTLVRGSAGRVKMRRELVIRPESPGRLSPRRILRGRIRGGPAGGSTTTSGHREAGAPTSPNERGSGNPETGLERRVMAFTECDSGLCIANLHATNDRPELAGEEVLLAAASAERWARGRPLLFGGDLNLRPGEGASRDPGLPDVFAELEARHGLRGATGPGAIDHLLVRGLEVLEPAAPWPPELREVPLDRSEPASGGLAVRLSDHAPVEALFGIRGARTSRT